MILLDRKRRAEDLLKAEIGLSLNKDPQKKRPSVSIFPATPKAKQMFGFRLAFPLKHELHHPAQMETIF